MRLKVTKNVRNSELLLPTIGWPVKAGAEIHITDEQYYKGDIQTALRKELIELIDEEGHSGSPFAKTITLTNISGKNVAFGTVGLMRDESIKICRNERESKGVQEAIDAGIVEVDDPGTEKIVRKPKKTAKPTSKAHPKGKKTQTKIAAKTKDTTKVTKDDIEDEDDITDRLRRDAVHLNMDSDDENENKDEDDAAEAEAEMRNQIRKFKKDEPKTGMTAWNPHEKRMMDRKEASNKVAKVVSSVRPKHPTMNDDGIQTGAVDFSDDGQRHAKKVTTASSRNPSKKKGIQPVGHAKIAGEVSDDDGVDMILGGEEDEMSFVDREQQRERVRSRPDILAAVARKRQQNTEID